MELATEGGRIRDEPASPVPSQQALLELLPSPWPDGQGFDPQRPVCYSGKTKHSEAFLRFCYRDLTGPKCGGVVRLDCTGLHIDLTLLPVDCTGLHLDPTLLHLDCTGLHLDRTLLHFHSTGLHLDLTLLHFHSTEIHLASTLLHCHSTGLRLDLT